MSRLGFPNRAEGFITECGWSVSNRWSDPVQLLVIFGCKFAPELKFRTQVVWVGRVRRADARQSTTGARRGGAPPRGTSAPTGN
jgi:hypothetical protein